MLDSFSVRSQLDVNGKTYHYASLKKFSDQHNIERLPFALKILLENLLRREDGQVVSAADITTLAAHASGQGEAKEIAYMPARVLLQDFTGVPAVVDLAAMRDAIDELGGDPNKINPLVPAELVIDHSIQVDYAGSETAKEQNSRLEFDRNKERYQFLRWGQTAFSNFKVVPPDTGIVHQVNLEYLARTVFTTEIDGEQWAYPDTTVGTDSHTTMINGLGVLAWGVGGIEAEAAMLGQPISMLIPEVIGFKLTGSLPEGTTATDLVLTVTQMLREKGVVGKFVEFYGEGLDHLPLADRATIANMAPEYGATSGLFPIDEETLQYLRLSGRSDEQVALVKAYAKAQGFFREPGMAEANYRDTLALDMGTVKASLAGPKRPQDRILLTDLKQSVSKTIADETKNRPPVIPGKLQDGSVVIAAITSCTNTSNPSVMMAAGLLARNAVEKGLKVPEWVKTSLAPGSKVVTEYLEQAGVMPYLNELGFNVVGYGCTTCIGNSGPLPQEISEEIQENGLQVCSVLSGNRNFEGRVHPDVRMNYLASPPLVVAYAIAGRMDIDLSQEPLAEGVYLKDIWPSQHDIAEAVADCLKADMFSKSYQDAFAGDERWNSIDIPEGSRYAWQDDSTYVQHPPYFTGMAKEPAGVSDITGARVLVKLGDSVTTDHISPAGAIKADAPAGEYLQDHGVSRKDFNSYGSRRGNHEIMMRGTFANVRLRNQLAPGTEGSVTTHYPSQAQMSIYEASTRYRNDNVPSVVLAGKEYGSGSSRDWAAKGPRLLGVKAAIAESYERIHRSNLVGMGILPLLFPEGENADSLGLTGSEIFDIVGLGDGSAKTVTVHAKNETTDEVKTFEAAVRLDTPLEVEYYRHGGILHYVLRQLLAS